MKNRINEILTKLPKEIKDNPYWEKVIEYFLTNPDNWDNGTKYAIDIMIHQTTLTSKMVMFAVARHLLFLYRFKTEEDFPFTYQPKWGKKIENFAKHVIVPEINKPFIFPEYRKFITYFIMGWRHKKDEESIITREIFDIEARKQWKSSYYAMMFLAFSLEILGDGNPRVFISGPQSATSRIPYDTAVNYIKRSPNLKGYFKKFHRMRIETANGGEIRHLPFEKSAIEGQNPSVTILTEYHLHPDDTMRESANSARNTSRKNSLIIYDTTKGHDISSVCYMREKSYKKFLREQILHPETIDKNFPILLFCAELDPEDYDNWKDTSLWCKANPNLGYSVLLEDLETEFNLIDSVHEEIEFKIKRLGMWVGNAVSYFDLKTIMDSDKATTPYVEKFFKTNKDLHLNGIVGVDLASISDTTAVVLQYEIPVPNDESIWVFIGKNFIPRDTADKKEKMDRVPYRDWAKKGWVEFTDNENDTVDYNFVSRYIKELKMKYNVSKLAYDPWQFNIVKLTLLQNNIFYEDDVLPVKQGVHLTPIFREFERKLRNKKICLLGNQLLVDHISNVLIKSASHINENITIHKINTASRIDGFMAMLYSSVLRIDNPAVSGSVIPYMLMPQSERKS